jgi:uncharacterized protein (TIGR02001 family)
MQKTKLLLAVLGALSAMPAFAADAPASPFTVTSNVGITSNYIYRGISQTSTNPAIQGGFDLAHSSGLYAGVWGSNVSWIADSGAVATGSVTMELDTYFGYKNSITEDVGYDVGFVRYNYLGDYTANTASGFEKADTAEVYAAISYKFLTAKYSYSVLDQFLTVPKTKGTNYIELNANYTIPDTTFTLIGHVGKQTYKGEAADALAAAGLDPTYSDYKVGVAKDFSGYVVTVAYSKASAPEGGFYDYTGTGHGNWGKGMTAISLTRTM